MSHIEWRTDGRRILLPVLILKPRPMADLTHVQATALLDTGATTSGIARKIARNLALPKVGRRPLVSAQGLSFAERFLFRIGLMPQDAGASDLPFIFEEMMGFELVDGASFDVLLGMDVLSQCDFELERNGTCRLRFG